MVLVIVNAVEAFSSVTKQFRAFCFTRGGFQGVRLQDIQCHALSTGDSGQTQWWFWSRMGWFLFYKECSYSYKHTHKCSFIKFYFLLWEFLGFTPVTENLGHLCSVCRVRTSIPSLGEKKSLFFAFLKSAKDFPQYLVTSTVCSNWADLGKSS